MVVSVTYSLTLEFIPDHFFVVVKTILLSSVMGDMVGCSMHGIQFSCVAVPLLLLRGVYN